MVSYAACQVLSFKCIIGDGKGGAMGLLPHMILMVFHRTIIFTNEIFSIQ